MADYTTNYNLKKPLITEKYSVDDQNGNMDILDGEIGKLGEQMAHLATKLDNYNSYASNKDANGIYTVVKYKRLDNTLYLKSTLSNPDTNGNYQTDTCQFYDTDGATLVNTITWTIMYDTDGNIVSKVVS